MSGANAYKINSFAALLLICIAFFSACTNPSARKENIIHINYSSGSLESLDPAYAKDLYVMWSVHMIYNTLVETDENLHSVPSLAKNWEVSSDGLTYTFHLRNDVYFQDNPKFPDGKGRKMLAADVAYSFNRLTDPKTASTGAWIFHDRVADVSPFVAVDDTTLQIKLKHTFRPFVALLSMPYCSIVPHEVTEYWGKDFRSHPCGTGPFQYKYWDEGNVLILRKNLTYWESGAEGQLPYADGVQISFVDSKASEFLMFMQGRLDFVNGIDGSFKDLVLSKDGNVKKEFRQKFHLDKSTYLNTEYIGFLTDTTNTLLKGQPTANMLIRQAINYAINRQKIVTYFKNGNGTPAVSGFIPHSMPGYDSTGSYGYHYNPQKSLELLEKAGFPNGKGLTPITILTPDRDADVVNFVASELQDVGIPAKIEVMQPNILKQQNAKSQALVFRAQWIADYPDAETYLAFFYSHFPAPPNYTRFKNATFDAWYEQSMNEPDSLRWQSYRRMDSLAMSYAPVIPLYYEQLLHFTQNNITGLRSSPMNLIDLKQVRIK
jgi:peptide/nickel transport system substrate-binding protein